MTVATLIEKLETWMIDNVLQNYARGNDFEDWKKVYFQRKQRNVIMFW